MADILLIVSINVLIDDFEAAFELAVKLLGNKAYDLILLNSLKWGLLGAELP